MENLYLSYTEMNQAIKLLTSTANVRVNISRAYKLLKPQGYKYIDLLRRTTRADIVQKLKQEQDKAEIKQLREQMNKTQKQIKQQQKQIQKMGKTNWRVDLLVYSAKESNNKKQYMIHDGAKYYQYGRVIKIDTSSDVFKTLFIKNGGKKNAFFEGTKQYDKLYDIVIDYMNKNGMSNIVAYMNVIRILDVKNVSKLNGKTSYNPKRAVYNDGIQGLYNEYTYYEVNPQFLTTGQLLKHCDMDGYRANSCFLSILVDTYYEAFQKKKSNGKRMYKDNITYEYLIELMGLEDKEQDIGCTIEQAKVFFEKFRLGLVVLDVFNKPLFEYIPENPNRKINPTVLYLIAHNNHVFKVNRNIKSIQQKCLVHDEALLQTTSSNYKILDLDDEKEYVVCGSLDDIVKSLEEVEDEQMNVKYTGDLNTLVYELVTNHGYNPQVSLDGSLVKGVRMMLNKVKIIVSSADVGAENDNNEEELNRDNLKVFDATYAEFYKWLVNKRHISYYDKDSQEYESNYPMLPITGYFEDTDLNLKGIDMNKAYTSNLCDMEHFPVFTTFDTWHEYDNHDIEDYTMYIVKANYSKCKSIRSLTLLFGAEYSRCYGYKLNRVNRELFNIVSFKRPSSLVKTNARQRVNELYKMEGLEPGLKKYIINVLLGLLEKKRNTARNTKLFTNLDEAKYYREEVGGEIDTLACNVEVADDGDGLFASITGTRIVQKSIYCLSRKAEKDLDNGFLYIKEMIYDIQRLKLYKLYQTCQSKGYKVYGIKTDCLLTDAKIKDLKETFNFNSELGGLKLETQKKVFGNKLKFTINSLIDTPKKTMNDIKISNEYDKEELAQINQDHQNILYLATDAGAGKSTASSCGFTPAEVLFVSPFNKQCIELMKDGYNAVTVNKFFCKGINGESMGYFEIPDAVKLIVFDEILLNNVFMLQSIKRFISNNNGEYKFFANGDVNQLEPVNFGVNNIKNETAYRMNCVKSMFNNMVVLKEIKRLNTEKDKVTMKQMKKDIFSNMNIADICKKYGINTITEYGQVKTTHNIAYFNFRCRMINQIIHKKQAKPKHFEVVGGVSIWKGLGLLCRKHYKTKGIKTFVNNVYTVERWNGKTVSIKDSFDEDVIIDMTYDKIWEYFNLPYCSTCHSCQGCSIDDDITIFDANTPYCNRYWLYTAITRARDLNKVNVFIHPESEVDNLSASRVRQYMNQKIDGCVEQDKMARRQIVKDSYVTYEWFCHEYERVGHKCQHCQCELYFAVDCDKKIETNITFDRVDDNMPHTKENCVLSCYLCNCKKIKY